MESDDKRNAAAIYLGLVIGTLIVYGQAIGHDFINLDDPDYVTSNVYVLRGLSWSGFKWAFTTGHASNWHPLTWLSHMLDAQFFGKTPGGPHFTNVLFHILNATLLFRFLRLATGATWRSATVAALFAWHPLHVESVAWISERKDVLSTFFWLLSASAYVKYARNPNPRQYVYTLLFFIGGLLSKPMVVTLPCVLLLLDHWPLQRFTLQNVRAKLGRLVLEKVPFLILAAISSWITLRVQTSAMVAADALPLGKRILNAIVSYATYLRKTVWPNDLGIFYPHTSIVMWQWMVAGVLLLLVTVLALVALRRKPYVLIGWLWYLGMLVPAIGLVQVGGQALADRYTYLPLVGAFIMAVWGLGELYEHSVRSRIAIRGATALVLVACLVLTLQQVGTWRDSEALFRHNLAVAPNGNSLAHDELGIALDEMGKTDEAIVELKKAIEIQPNSPSPYNSLGWIYEREKKIDLAEETYRTALRWKSDYASAHFNLARLLVTRENWTEARVHYEAGLRGKPDSAEGHFHLGIALTHLNEPDLAVEEFKEALRLWPDLPEAESQWGGVLYDYGKLDEARFHYEAALRLQPDFAHAHVKLGLILARQGQFERAKYHLFAAVQSSPTNDAAHYNLGAVYAAEGKWAEAASSFAEASRLKPDDAETHGRLAAALSQSGNVESAITHYREAIRLKPDWAEAQRALAKILATNPKPELRNGAEAVRLAERANELTGGNDPRMLTALDQAYAEVGKFAEAIQIAERVRAMGETNKQGDLGEKAARRLESYRAGKALYE